MLQNGERLEKPSYMPDTLGALMAECWMGDPKKRPTFSHLEKELENLLGDDAKSHYLTMNSPYMEMK